MNNLDKLTRELAAALQLSPEYARFCAAKEADEADAGLQAQMQQLELLRMQYQNEAQKDSPDQALMQDYSNQFKTAHEGILANENMKEYQAAGGALDGLLKRVTGILAGAAQGEDPWAYEPAQGCGNGGCGGGGCGGGGCG